MDIPDGVIAERFHPSALQAGLPQVDLPCGDPACGAEPGEACGPFCTHGDAGTPGRADLVHVGGGEFAVRGCPRCGGSGQDASSPDRGDCRCRVGSLEALELRAGDLYARAKIEAQQAHRARTHARRIEAHAQAAALREYGITAQVHPRLPEPYSIAIDTRFGRILAGVDPADLWCVHVERVDGTRWALRTHSDARSIATTLRDSVPELAHDGDRLTWVVAVLPTNSNPPDRPVVVFVARPPAAGQRCSVCVTENHTGECPGLPTHMAHHRRRWLDSGAQLVCGAFPMPADAPEDGVEAAEAVEAAISSAAYKVWIGELVIT